MAQRCCCCISLRIGTILIALILLVQSSISAYYEFKNFDDTSFPNETIGIIVGVWNVFKAVVAVGGLYGGITGKQGFVRIFGWALGLTLVIYLGLVILSAIIHFQNQSSMVDACVHKAQVNNVSGLNWDPKENWSKPFKKRQDPSTNTTNTNTTTTTTNESDTLLREKCTQAIKLYLVFLLSVDIFVVLLWFYFVSIVSSYSSELRKQLKHKRLKDSDDFGERGGTLDRLSMSSTSDKHPARGILHHDNV